MYLVVVSMVHTHRMRKLCHYCVCAGTGLLRAGLLDWTGWAGNYVDSLLVHRTRYAVCQVCVVHWVRYEEREQSAMGE